MPTHGGARRGAGRKRLAPRPRVVHRERPRLDRSHPLHVTIRLRTDVPPLRTRPAMRTIVRVLREARGRFGLRVIQFAVLGDHLHFIVEANGRESLSRGMRGLGTRLAIHLNRLFARRGSLFADRCHARPLATPLEVRRGLCYALQNFRKHEDRPKPDLGTLRPRTWLLAIGWRRHGPIGVDEVPGWRSRNRSQCAVNRKAARCSRIAHSSR